ncbi:hypothetical protein [Pseudomonas sp. GD03696]|uniref:hypothetical protein n=1 Tax=Pseudomonas sp. GD03696 TaxID=2975368 RepID=UPI0024489F69|nr:hypothetical protein [Pseudomonas sp. GD03696]MDH1927766.1 hypothetical protein [Pseudomonas sp. GD03696]
MARTNYTDDQKKAFVSAWLATGKPKSRWHKEQVAAGNIEGHYNAFDQWVKLWQGELQGQVSAQPQAQAPAGGHQVARTTRTSSPNALSNVGRNSSLLAEFQQTLLPEDVQAKYIAFLEAKVSGLTAELEALQEENAQLHTRLEALEAPEAQQENE